MYIAFGVCQLASVDFSCIMADHLVLLVSFDNSTFRTRQPLNYHASSGTLTAAYSLARKNLWRFAVAKVAAFCWIQIHSPVEIYIFSLALPWVCRLPVGVCFRCLWLIGYRLAIVAVTPLHYFHFFRTAKAAESRRFLLPLCHFGAGIGEQLCFMQQLKQSNCFMAAIVAAAAASLFPGDLWLTGVYRHNNSCWQKKKKRLAGKFTIAGVPAAAI